MIVEENCERKEAFVSNKNADSRNQTSGINWTEFLIFQLLGCLCVCVFSQTMLVNFIFTYSQSHICVSTMYYSMKSGQKMDLV